MDNNEITSEELIKLNQIIDNLYVPEPDLLSQLPKEFLMFIHLKTIGKIKIDSLISDCTFTTFKRILVKNKKLLNVNKESVIEDLFTYLDYTKFSDSSRGLNLKKIFNKDYSEENHYYACLNEIFNELWLEIYNKINTVSNNDFQQELIRVTKEHFVSKAPTYNLIVLFTVYKNILPLLNSKDLKNIFLPIINFILIEFLSIKDELHQKYRNILLETDNSLIKVEEISKKKDDELIQYKNKLKELTKEKRNLEKKVKTETEKIEEFSNTLNSFKNIIEAKNIDNTDIITEIKNIKTDITKNIYDNIINTLNEKISDLKNSLKDKSKEYNNLNKEYKILSGKSTLSLLKEYIEINGFTDNLKNLVKPYVFDYKEESLISLNTKEENNIDEILGYCTIINNKHYVKFLNGKTIELINLPENNYLTEGQIILSSYSGVFKYSFQYTCSGIELQPLFELAYITVVDDTYQIGFNGKLRDLKNIPKDIKFRNMQAVIVDKEGNYIRNLKRIHLNADSLISSMKIKGHTPYFVVKILSNNKFILRKIDSDLEFEKEINPKDIEIKLYSVISLNKNNEVVSYFPTGKFYTLSSYYKKDKYGVIEFKNNIAYANIIEDNTLIKISDLPRNINLEEDMIVRLDEFGCFLELIDTNIDNDKKENKNIKKTTKNSKEKSYTGAITKEILILGNISYAESYKEAFLNKGYSAESLDGYETWNRVLREMKNKDLVIITTKFVSHDNTLNMKKTSQPVIFSKFDGANILAKQALIYFAKAQKNKNHFQINNNKSFI